MTQSSHVHPHDIPSPGSQPRGGLGQRPWSFAHPEQVLSAPGLSRDRKRAILAEWASDVWAVESAPALRHPPGGGEPVPVDEVLVALRALDGDLAEEDWEREQDPASPSSYWGRGEDGRALSASRAGRGRASILWLSRHAEQI